MLEKKKILILSLAYYPHVGGAEVAIKEITDRISDIEFHMVTMRFSPSELAQEQIGNILVHRIGNGSSMLDKFFFQLRAAPFASALHRQHTYDAVWAMMAHSAGVPAALFKQSHPDVPLLLTLQEGDPPKHIERTMVPLWPLFTRAFTKADRVQTISNFLGVWARARHFKGPLIVIPNGVDLLHFAGASIPHEGTVLVTASRLVHKNAVDDIIRALKLLPDVRLCIAGTGKEESALRMLARREGVEQRIEFIGHVDHAQLPNVLHASDIFIRPSRSEGMGNAFIEAMAAGIPVIGTAVGGIPDFLHDNETGFVVEVNNPKSIAAAVQKIISDKTNTARIVQNAMQLSKEYDWNIVAERMEKEAFEPLWQK